MASLVDRVAAATAPLRVAEAGTALAVRAAPAAPGVLANRTGFVQGVPRSGFGENEASAQAGASDMSRADFLQELWEEYLKCPWSWACVNVIARTVTAGGLQVRWDGASLEQSQDQKQPAKPGPVLALERLFAFCNPAQDIRQLMRNTVADLQVFGDAMIEVVWFAGIPVALYNQDLPTTFPVTDAHGTVERYVQKLDGGDKAEFRPEQIIHITLDSARPSVFGISPTHAVEESIVAWMRLHACEKEAARRGLPPNVHADLPAGTPDADVLRWQQQYASRNIGPSNVGTPITTKGGGKVSELQTAKLTDILAAKREARNEIVSGYGVPPAKVGIIESGNLGGGTGSDQNKSFWLDIIAPIAMLIAEKLQFALAVKAFRVTGWHVEFGGVDYRDDQTIENIRDMRLRNGSWTQNRLRADIGEPGIDGGDDAVLVARQDIVLWEDMDARSKASIAALARIDATGSAGPSPATGTGRPAGPGGAPGPQPPSESAVAVAEALVRRLWRSGAVAEHTPVLTPRERVWNQLSRNFPASSLAWVKDADVSDWDGPSWLRPDEVDTRDMDEWGAGHQPAVITRLRRRLRSTGRMKPVVVIRHPGSGQDVIVDGHHRALAAIQEGHAIRAWVGRVHSASGPWLTLAARQHRKAESAPAAGVTESAASAKQLALKDLRERFPARALGWASRAAWAGPAPVSLSRVDIANSENWPGRKDTDSITYFRDEIRAGTVKPVILVKRPGIVKLLLVDGHHRVLAAIAEKAPILALIATVDADKGPWDTLHRLQRQDGQSSPSGRGGQS